MRAPFAVFLIVALSGCLQAPPEAPAAATYGHPAALPASLLANGSFDVARATYDVLVSPVEGGAALPAYEDRLRGDVHYPKDASGPFPLVLFLHGMHETCDVAGFGLPASDVCEPTPATDPALSYLGYDYLAAPLATRGYVVVSIDANEANDRDYTALRGPQLRGDLVLHTLDALAAGSILPDLKGKIDMTRIGLMGHSRGGEGVVAAYVENQARSSPYPIRALFALAPVDFQGETPRHVPFAVLLPSCDGDVSDLEGAWYYDDTRNDSSDDAPRSLLLVMGANHNAYNTVWTSDDASYLTSDPYCSPHAPTRLSPEAERATGLALVPSFFRLYLGNETGLRPLFTGEATLGDGSLLHVAYTPGAASRQVLYEAGKDAGPRADGFDQAALCGPYDGASPPLFLLPRSPPTRPPCARSVDRAVQLNVSWSRPATLSFDREIDASRFSVLSFRAAVLPKDARNPPSGQDLRVALTDAAGRTASVDLDRAGGPLFVETADQHAQAVLTSVRVPLADFRGIDLARVARVQLVFDRTPAGAVTLTDVELQR